MPTFAGGGITQVPIQQVQADNSLSTILKSLGGGMQQGYAARAAEAPTRAVPAALPANMDLGLPPVNTQAGNSLPGFEALLAQSGVQSGVGNNFNVGPPPVDQLAGISGQSAPSSMLLQRYGMALPMMY